VTRPFLSRLTKIGHSFTPEDQARRIQHKLDVAGNPAGWNVDRVVGLKMLGFVVGLVGSVLATMLTGVPLLWMLVICIGASVVGFEAPSMWIYQLGYNRMEQMRRELPDAIDLLTISVEAGLAFDAALARVARDSEGPVSMELARVLQEMNIGVARVPALRNLADRTQLAELKTFVTAMVQADTFGVPIARVLRVQSTELRTKRRQRAEELAQKVPIKILFPLLFCILPTLVVAVLGPGVIMIGRALFGISE
jgi:tight adherence protein C